MSTAVNNKQLDFSLLIPCYNNLEGLQRSIQTVNYYGDRFIIVVVDDGSQIPVTPDDLKTKVEIDVPVVVLQMEHNRGITAALNAGLKWIEDNTHSKYIARLDCGDTCSKDRFLKQVEYMEAHPATGLLGSWCAFENRKGTRYIYKTPTDERQIVRAMHFKNIFIHPTVMFRRNLLTQTGYYPDEFPYAEDYALFWQLIKISASHILAELLVVCEINSDGISLRNRRRQFSSRIGVILKYGTNPFLKLAGAIRITALRLIPQPLALRLKKLIKA